MKKFDFDTFAEEQHKQLENTFTLKEVKDILYIGEDAYIKDSPNSTGKTLILDFLAFKGKKDDESPIDYSVQLNNGLTIWVTKNSNLKGKSSVFKIIKFALTGENKISEHVKKWIEEVLLCFRIGTHHYTIHIINKRGLLAKLYPSKINNWEELNVIQKKSIFETTTQDDFKKEIQNFFFKQFSYYSLNWTQNSTKKDNFDLIESSASWNTYFKSIYLESKDYGVLFYGGTLAHQGQKLFQTLMGLDLTYAINQLRIKQDKLNNEKAKEQLRTQNQQGDSSKKKELLKQEVAKIVTQIEELNKKPLNSNNQELIRLQAEYSRLVEQYNYFSKLTKEHRILSEKIGKEEEKIYKKINIYNSIKNRLASIEKRILELQEHIQAGIFLSDLEIKNCPSCHHSVDDTKKKSNLAAHKCPLCSDGIIDADEVDTESYEDKIRQLQAEQTQLETQKKASEVEGKEMRNEINVLKKNLTEKEKALQKGDTNSLSQQIQATQNQIDVLLTQNPINNTQREELLIKKALLEYQLKEIETNLTQTVPLSKYENKIKLLENAIVALKKQRFEIGNEVIQRLQGLMLKEVHSFGVTSITGIKITENFDVKYLQGGEEISFERISEGEQLRAKLAFYLSLIQLDIENAMGKHTRFLMIDSPGKEEAGRKYMEGLINVLQDIEQRYGNELQILIATADSRFENKLKNQFVFQEDEYVF